MVGAQRVEHPFHPRQPGEVIGQRHRRRLRPVKAQVKGQHAALGQPAIEGAGREAGCHRKDPHLLGQFRVARHGIAQHHVGMPREQLGHRMDHDIGPVLEGADRFRRGERVVHRQQDTARLAQCCQPVQVGHPQRRVRHHLDQHHPRLGADRRRDRLDVTGIGQRCGDAHARQVFLHQPQRPTIELVAADHVIARGQKPQQHGGNRRHARAGDDTAHGPLHRVQPLGHHVGIRVSLARIGIAVNAPLVLRIQLIGAFAGIDDRGAQRRDDRPAHALGKRIGADERTFGVLHFFTAFISSRNLRMLSW